MKKKATMFALFGIIAAAFTIGSIVGDGIGTASASQETRLPNGRNLTPITGGVYPQDYYPNTERLKPTEMRIVALGTGMPQVIQKKTKASGWYVELGNGDKFLFDLGTGSMENLAALQPDWSQIDKVFISHLHSDHAGDFAPLYIGGWMNGRYTALNIYGPTGAKPELGTKAFVENQIKAWAWDIAGRKGTFPDAGGVANVQEFDYKTVQVIYDVNGVKITQFPAIHALDGSVSFRLDWGKRSFVFGGDSAPNNWYIKQAKGAEVAVHECFFTARGLGKAMDIDPYEATYITNYVHTPPAGFGKIMSAVKPRLAVGYHIWPNPEYFNETIAEVAKTYDGPYVQATDLTVINVTDEQVIVREAIVSELALPTGTTQGYLDAYRTPTDANTKITEFLSSQRWEGFRLRGRSLRTCLGSPGSVKVDIVHSYRTLAPECTRLETKKALCSSYPQNGFVDELQMPGFPHTCHPSYGALAPTPAGFTFLLNTLAFIGHTEFLYRTGSSTVRLETTAASIRCDVSGVEAFSDSLNYHTRQRHRFRRR